MHNICCITFICWMTDIRIMNLVGNILKNRLNKETYLHRNFYQGVTLVGHLISLMTIENSYSGCEKQLIKMMLKLREYWEKLIFDWEMKTLSPKAIQMLLNG